MALPYFFLQRQTYVGKDYIKQDDFIDYLKQEHTKEDSMKLIDRWNIQRTFNGYQDKPVSIDNEKYLPVIAVLKFTFSLSDKLDSCHKLGAMITEIVCDKHH